MKWSTKEDGVAERYKALTRNQNIRSSSPLSAGHAGGHASVYSLLASFPASWDF